MSETRINMLYNTDLQCYLCDSDKSWAVGTD